MIKESIINFFRNEPETPITVINADFHKGNGNRYVFDDDWQIYEAIYSKDTYYKASSSESKKYWKLYTQNKLALLSCLQNIDGIISISNYNGNVFAKIENDTPKGLFILTKVSFQNRKDKLKELQEACNKNGFTCAERHISDFLDFQGSPNDNRHIIINLLLCSLSNINDMGNTYQCTNLDSDFYVFNDGWTLRQKNGTERFDEMIVCLRISVKKSNAVELAVNTFSRLDKLKELYNGNKRMLANLEITKKYRRTEDGDNSCLIPTNGETFKDEECYAKYSLDRNFKHTIEDEVFNGTQFSSENPNENDCKNGIFFTLIDTLNVLYGKYACFSYAKGKVIRTKKLDYHATRQKKFERRIDNFRDETYKLHIIDTLDPLDEKKNIITIFKDSLSEFLGIDKNLISISTETEKGDFNFNVIHEKDYYKKINSKENKKAKEENRTPNLITDKYVRIEGYQNEKTGYFQNVTVETLNRNKTKDKIKPYLLRALFNELLAKRDIAKGEVSYKIEDDVIFGIKKIVVKKCANSKEKKKEKIPIFLILTMAKETSSFDFYISTGMPEFELGSRTISIQRAFDRIDDTKEDNFVISTSHGTALMITSDFKCLRDHDKKPNKNFGPRSRNYRQEAMPALYDVNLFEYQNNYYIISGEYPESSRNFIIEKTSRPRLIECIEGDKFEMSKDILNYLGELYLGPNGPGAYPFAGKILNEIYRQWMLDHPELLTINESIENEDNDDKEPLLFYEEDNNDEPSTPMQQTIIGLTLPSDLYSKFKLFAGRFKSVSASVRYILRKHYNMPEMWADLPEEDGKLLYFEKEEINNNKVTTTVTVGNELFERIKETNTQNLSYTIRNIVMNFLRKNIS